MPSEVTLRRLAQLSECFAALGTDFHSTVWDRDHKMHRCHVLWAPGSPDAGPLISFDEYGPTSIAATVAAGLRLSTELAQNYPDLELPEVVWT